MLELLLERVLELDDEDDERPDEDRELPLDVDRLPPKLGLELLELELLRLVDVEPTEEPLDR